MTDWFRVLANGEYEVWGVPAALVFGASGPLEVAQNVRIITTTIAGEAPLERDLGLSMDPMDEPLHSLGAMALIRSRIPAAVAKWEPRARVTEIAFEELQDSPDPGGAAGSGGQDRGGGGMSDRPDVNFVETDGETIKAGMVAAYEKETGRTMYPADPERLAVLGHAALVIQERANLNYTGRQNLLRYAADEKLAALGELMDESKIEAQAATVTLEFSLDEALAFNVTIPSGTRATPDQELMFATLETAVIEAGRTSVQAAARCRTSGAAGNGFLAGQIDLLVDQVDHVAEVANVDTSTGGADEESDDSFRARIQLSPNKVAKAGPGAAYRYHAAAYFGESLLDFKTHKDEPCEVQCLVLLTGGALPSQAQRQAFWLYLDQDEKLPEGIEITVPEVETVSYGLTAVYYVLSDYSAVLSSIQTAALAAKEEYLLWQRSALGRDVTPSQLVSLLMAIEGMKRVEISSPSFQSLAVTQVAQAGTVNFSFGGIEDA